MTPDHQSKDKELQQKEAELRKREIKVRMRELEAELEQPTPVQATVTTDDPSSSKGRPWYKRLPDIGKFCLIVIAVIVAVRLASWLATAVMVFGVAWAGYKLFLEGDRKN